MLRSFLRLLSNAGGLRSAGAADGAAAAAASRRGVGVKGGQGWCHCCPQDPAACQGYNADSGANAAARCRCGCCFCGGCGGGCKRGCEPGCHPGDTQRNARGRWCAFYPPTQPTHTLRTHLHTPHHPHFTQPSLTIPFDALFLTPKTALAAAALARVPSFAEAPDNGYGYGGWPMARGNGRTDRPPYPLIHACIVFSPWLCFGTVQLEVSFFTTSFPKILGVLRRRGRCWRSSFSPAGTRAAARCAAQARSRTHIRGNRPPLHCPCSCAGATVARSLQTTAEARHSMMPR